MAPRSEKEILEEYVSLMAKNINSDIDPREDFMKYACGKFNWENYDRKRGEYPPNRYGDPFDKILENETLNYPSLVKARNFYKSYENDIRKLLKNEGLREFCGGFPAFDDNWTGENFDWIKTAAILSAMDMDTIISYSIRYEDNRRIMEISVEIPDEDDVIPSVEEVLGKMGISGDKTTEIIDDLKMVQEKSQSQAPESDEKELRDKFLEKFFEISTGKSLTEDDTLEMDSYDVSYMKGLLNIFAEIEPKSVANYITCLAIHKHGEDKIFHSAHKLVTNYFAPAIVAAGFSEFWNDGEETKRKEVRERFLNSFEIHKDKFKGANTSSICTFADEDKVVPEYIAANFSQGTVDSEYENLEIDSENFFQNIVNIIKHGSTASVRKYFSNQDQDMQLQIISFLQDLVNTNNKPMLFHFSGWELEMWRELIWMYGLEENSSEYRVMSDAINAQMITFDIPEDSKLVKMSISIVKALKFAFEDYKTWLNENQDTSETQAEILKKLNLNNNQAFFVAFGQHYCGEDDDKMNSALLSLSNCDDFAQEFGIKRSV